MSPAILEIENLALAYDKKSILEQVSFDVSPGELVSIIGPNGTGKTTLIKAVSRQLSLAAGEIRIQGKSISGMNSRNLAGRMAVVMQNLEPVAMGVEEYILLGRLPFFKKFQFFETRNDLELAQKYMDLTHTRPLADKRMDQISGGERQLAAIARALTQEPALLLLDEPTSHLDITHQVQILDLIRSLTRQLNLAVLMVIHDMNLAAEYTDRLILLDKATGSVRATGTPDQVLTRENMEEVYLVPVRIQRHPVSGKPAVFPISGQSAEAGLLDGTH